LAPEELKDNDKDPEPQHRSTFLASWVMLVHGLYRQRVSVASQGDGNPPPARASAWAIIAAWKKELRTLLWAYAPVDIDSAAEVHAVPHWRNTFALSSWYGEPPDRRDPYNKVVIITFPGETSDQPEVSSQGPDLEAIVSEF